MKKATLVFAVALTLAACGTGNTEAVVTDTTAVAADTTAVVADTTANVVDTTATK
jgi:uncharacterized protein YcfL